MLRTAKFKIKTSSHDRLVLETLSNEYRLVWNHLMNYTNSTSDYSLKNLNQISKHFRKENKLTVSAKSVQNLAIKVESSFKSFLALKKKGDKTSKPPRKFISWKNFCTFTLDSLDAYKIIDNEIHLQANNKSKSFWLKFSIPKKFHNLENIKTVTVSRNEDDYFISLSYSTIVEPLPLNDNFLSIDLGTSYITSCFSNVVDSFSVTNNKYYKLEKQIDSINSLLSKKVKRSKKFNKLRAFKKRQTRKLVNKNIDFQRKVSSNIVNLCLDNNISRLIIGDIQTKKLPTDKCSEQNKNNLNRGSLSRTKSFLQSAAEKKGLMTLLVNEAYTSQTNPLNGLRELKSTLETREHEVRKEQWLDRDIVGAINIAFKDKTTRALWSGQLETLLEERKFLRMCLRNEKLSTIQEFENCYISTKDV